MWSRGGLNWGLRASGIACAENLKISFPLTQPIFRTLFNKAAGKFSESLSPECLGGFCTGESNFFIAVSNPKGSGTSTWLRFAIAQDSIDIALFSPGSSIPGSPRGEQSVVKFFGCGVVW